MKYFIYLLSLSEGHIFSSLGHMENFLFLSVLPTHNFAKIGKSSSNL